MRSIVTTFVKYPAYSWIVMFVILGAGALSYLSIKKSFFPELKSHNVMVTVAYPGASPEEMEEGVVLKVEEAIKGIEGIEKVTSVSQENTATITIQGFQKYNADVLLTDVKNAVDRINSFPVDAEKPVVFKAKAFDAAANLVVQGNTDLASLKIFAERIEDDFLASGLISQVEVRGVPNPEISIEVPEEILLRYNLTFEEIGNAVRQNNRDISAGSVKARDEEVLIRSRNKSYSANGIGDIILRTQADGNIIRIGDIAQVREQFADDPNKTLYNGKNAVSINISKLPEEDLIKITDFIKTYVAEFNATNSAVQLTITNDRSIGLNQRLDLLKKNGGAGLILVLITLGLFMNARLSFWVGMGIPFSFLGMFIIAALAGITINMISLFGMILVVGILVDDGIVVGENVYSEIEKGRSGYWAAIHGSLDVLPSVFTSVSTTIVAFVPFFFLEGRIGEFISQMALVVIACLAWSMVECTFILPAHLAHAPKNAKLRTPPLDPLLNFLRFRIYKPVIETILTYKYAAVAGVIALFMMISGAFQGGLIQTTFFPDIEGDETTVSLVLKPGTRENVTEDYLKRIEQSVWEVNAELRDSFKLDSIIESTRLDIGTSGTESGGHTGKLDVAFMDGEDRPVSQGTLESMIREKIKGITGAEKLTVGGRRIFGKPVSIAMMGRDLVELEAAKEALKMALESFPTLKDVTDNDVSGKREVRLKLKPRAFVLGLDHGSITRQVRQGFFGEEVQRLQSGRDEVRVWVRYPESDRVSIGKLEEMKIKTPDGRQIPFLEVADYEIGRGIVNINHFNGSREIRVEAEVAVPNTPVPPILAEVRDSIMPGILANFPGVRVSYEGQAAENSNFSSSGGIWFPIAFVTMALLITLSFRSFWQALIIMLMIPLGMAGAFLGHGLEGKPVSILSIYGLLALSGIIINDAVVLLHRYNQFVAEGMEVRKAVINAGVSRFRAIMLTSVTTVVGLYPLILEKSRQAQFLIPMAISVAYGVLLGTLFLLLFFPVLILILNDIRVFLNWLWYGGKIDPNSLEPARKDAVKEAARQAEKQAAEAKLAPPRQYSPVEDWPVEFPKGPDPLKSIEDFMNGD
ncbi:MAG: efflux RND transporter permease subunit [Bacteroidia bacterium]|nr:efflux RND transporter permease subunit [Bacteroidia bacterium]